jgi:hypothetical protein
VTCKQNHSGRCKRTIKVRAADAGWVKDAVARWLDAGRDPKIKTADDHLDIPLATGPQPEQPEGGVS